MEEKKGTYLNRIRQDFVGLAAGHGMNESGANELADFMVEKMEFSFRNGLRYAKRQGAGAEMREIAA